MPPVLPELVIKEEKPENVKCLFLWKLIVGSSISSSTSEKKTSKPCTLQQVRMCCLCIDYKLYQVASDSHGHTA